MLGLDNKILLQLAILGLLEEGLTVGEVAQLTKKTVGDVWFGFIDEKKKQKEVI